MRIFAFLLLWLMSILGVAAAREMVLNPARQWARSAANPKWLQLVLEFFALTLFFTILLAILDAGCGRMM